MFFVIYKYDSLIKGVTMGFFFSLEIKVIMQKYFFFNKQIIKKTPETKKMHHKTFNSIF